MTALPILALATGLNLAALPAPAANTQVAEARLNTLVNAAAPVATTQAVEAALAAGLRRYAEASAAQVAAAAPKPADAGDFAPAARQRIDAMVAGASPRLHREAVATALAGGTRRLGRQVDTQIASLHADATDAGEVAVLRAPVQEADATGPDAP